ncbi:MAG: aspartate-semialdehyde dehydrogenase [Acidobacteriota bacterium]
MNLQEKLKVAVIGASGSVGQRFVQLLADHPWFELVCVTGSERRVGKKYGETTRWILAEPMPEKVRDMVVVPSDPASVDAELVFSALPKDVAREIEPQFAAAGIGVCTNAGAFRGEPDVPILVPEVNAEHAQLVPIQRRNRDWSGFIVTNPNCTSTGMTVALKTLLDAFGVEDVFAVSLQALSGAGYPGVPSMDIVDNVIPFIKGEEEKVEWEPRKMLGTLQDGRIELASLRISAHTNRVQVSDGHLVCLSVRLGRRAGIEEIKEALQSYQAPEVCRDLPSAPRPPILVREEDDRPQPRLDRMEGAGMTTVVGRVRPDNIWDVRLAVLSHNTIRGAAGGSLFNAELLVTLGYIG